MASAETPTCFTANQISLPFGVSDSLMKQIKLINVF